MFSPLIRRPHRSRRGKFWLNKTISPEASTIPVLVVIIYVLLYAYKIYRHGPKKYYSRVEHPED